MSFVEENAGTARAELQYAEEGPTGAGRLRLDALTIAGLTGTPAAANNGRFFARRAGPADSPMGSDATLGSIQDSACGDDEEDKDGGGSSVMSDDLGEIAFTDDEHSGDDDSSSDDGVGFREEGGEAGAPPAQEAAREGGGDRSLGSASIAGERCDRLVAAQRAAAPPPVVEHACGEGLAAASGGDGEAARPADASSPPVAPLPAARVKPGGTEGEEERRQRTQHQCSDDRKPEAMGGSASSSRHTCLRGGPATTTTAAATASASTSAVGGADSGGGGVSCSLQALPPGTVPTVTCKVLVVGNAKCGKSSIISRFVSNRFSADYNSTVGADYAMKDVSLQGGRQVRLQLWDIAGQDRFAKLTRAYFRRAKGAVVVCDVTREGTFDAIVRWKEEIDLWCQNEGCELPVYLLANKCDLLTEVQDSFLAGARMEKTCRDSGFAGWFITSAKRGDNINTALTKLLEHALEAEDRRNRGTEGLRPSSNGGDDGGGAPKGEPFQLSNRRDGGGLGVQQGACCQ